MKRAVRDARRFATSTPISDATCVAQKAVNHRGELVGERKFVCWSICDRKIFARKIFGRNCLRIWLLLGWVTSVGLIGCSQQPVVESPAAKLSDTVAADASTAESGRNANSARSESATSPEKENGGTQSASKQSAVEGDALETAFRFREIGKESGFDFQRNDDMQGQKRILEVNGGGAAVFDFDQDGWLDIFMSNGCRLPLEEDQRQTPGKFFRNRRDMTFQDCSDASGLKQFGFCYGCAVADVDEDGFEDLYVTAIGGNQFWINNGDGTFREIADDNGTRTDRWGASAAFADLNADQTLDLYVTNYLEESGSRPRLCPEPKSPTGYVGCTPAMFPGVPDTLFLSNGAGGYVDASAAAGLDRLPGKALGVVICDLGTDSQSEIYVANDGQPNYLLTIELLEPKPDEVRGIRLTDEALTANVALGYSGQAQAGMGIAAVDIDRDGARDLFLTHFFGDTNTLYLNRTVEGLRFFEDATRSSFLGLPSLSKLGFGVAGIDVDNNGWTDLVVANGHVEDRMWYDPGQPYHMTPQLFQNRGDRTFSDVSSNVGDYFQKPTLGRGVAAGDLDRDGRLDVVVSHQLEPSVILHNETPPSGGSLVLRLIGTTDCRTPIGTKVKVLDVEPVLHDQLIGGGSYQAAHANELHLAGLNDASHEVEIQWPNGKVEVIRGLKNGAWIIRQDAGFWQMDVF